jgi:hypothetical protein
LARLKGVESEEMVSAKPVVVVSERVVAVRWVVASERAEAVASEKPEAAV